MPPFNYNQHPKTKAHQTFVKLTPTEKKMSVSVFKGTLFKNIINANRVYIKTLVDKYVEISGIYQMLKMKHRIKFIQR